MATPWPRRHERTAAPDSSRRASVRLRILFALLAAPALVAAACTTERASPVLVDSIMPRTAEIAGGLVIVHGQNFAPGAQVQASSTLLLTTWINSHYLAARLPLELPGGTVDIIVRNPDGTQARLRDALTLGPASPARPQVASAATTPARATPSPTPTPTPSATPALAPTPTPTPELVPLPATTALPTPPRVPVAQPTTPPVQVLVPPASRTGPVPPAPMGPAPYAGPIPSAAISPAQSAPPQQPAPAPAPAEQPVASQPASPPPQNPQPVATRVTEPPPPPAPAATQPHLICPPGLRIPPDAARQVTCF
jgi:hypothetical protein